MCWLIRFKKNSPLIKQKLPRPILGSVPEAKLVTTVNADNVTIKSQFNTKINDVTTDSNTPSNSVEKLSPSLVVKRVEDA